MRQTPEDFAATLSERRLVVIGETHGTDEFPRLALAVATGALVRGPVRIALEHDADGQPALDEYLDSEGDASDRERFLALPAWSTNDGRGSVAVFNLVEGCRRLRADGKAVDVRLVDHGSAELRGAAFTPTRRDQVMAERLVDACSSSAAVVALIGSVHARHDGRVPFRVERGYETAGAILRRTMSFVSLLGTYSDGTAWCTRTKLGRVVSGRHRFRGTDRGSEPFIELVADEAGYDGRAYVGRITASPPANA